jgi:type I restriction enzyme S subunit
MTPSKNRSDFWDGNINWFSPKDIKSDELVESELKITSVGVSETGLQLYPPGCLFMVARSGILKRTFPVAINRVEATANQDLKVFSPFIPGLERYLQIMFRGMTDFILSALVKTGTTVQSLKYEQFECQPIPLPPLPEQQRIVAKVGELTALCDRLETAQAERESRRNRLVAASLRRLNQPADTLGAEGFRDQARFHLRHLARLTTRPEHIQQLRQTILNLAVRGRLVRQNPGDGPVAAELAESDRAREEMARKDHRADGHPQRLLAADDRWVSPFSWEWRALADLVLFIDYRGKTPEKAGQGVRLITAKNVRKGVINLSPEEFLTERNYRAWMTRGFPRAGDVLFTTEAPMGNAAVVHLPDRFALAQRVICFRPYGALNPEFLALQLLAEPFQAILSKTSTGLTAKGIKAAKLKRLPVVVPPLAEQHRIVAKVDELMALCDRLEAQLTTSHSEHRRLLEAVLANALGPAA